MLSRQPRVVARSRPPPIDIPPSPMIVLNGDPNAHPMFFQRNGSSVGSFGLPQGDDGGSSDEEFVPEEEDTSSQGSLLIQAKRMSRVSVHSGASSEDVTAELRARYGNPQMQDMDMDMHDAHGEIYLESETTTTQGAGLNRAKLAGQRARRAQQQARRSDWEDAPPLPDSLNAIYAPKYQDVSLASPTPEVARVPSATRNNPNLASNNYNNYYSHNGMPPLATAPMTASATPTPTPPTTSTTTTTSRNMSPPRSARYQPQSRPQPQPQPHVTPTRNPSPTRTVSRPIVSQPVRNPSPTRTLPTRNPSPTRTLPTRNPSPTRTMPSRLQPQNSLNPNNNNNTNQNGGPLSPAPSPGTTTPRTITPRTAAPGGMTRTLSPTRTVSVNRTPSPTRALTRPAPGAVAGAATGPRVPPITVPRTTSPTRTINSARAAPGSRPISPTRSLPLSARGQQLQQQQQLQLQQQQQQQQLQQQQQQPAPVIAPAVHRRTPCSPHTNTSSCSSSSPHSSLPNTPPGADGLKAPARTISTASNPSTSISSSKEGVEVNSSLGSGENPFSPENDNGLASPNVEHEIGGDVSGSGQNVDLLLVVTELPCGRSQPRVANRRSKP